MTRSPYKKAFLALVLIFGIAFLMTSCSSIRNSCDCALTGYGHHNVHMTQRK